jgi:hypothetical protein
LKSREEEMLKNFLGGGKWIMEKKKESSLDKKIQDSCLRFPDLYLRYYTSLEDA